MTTKANVSCPYCKSTDTIKRGTAKREKGGSIQVYGCKECKRRFTLGDDEKARVPAKAITILQSRILELEEANRTLLVNNVKLAAENTRLSVMTDTQHTRILALDKEKTDCKLKCELVVGEKNRIIAEKEQRLQNIRNARQYLDEMTWTREIKHSFGAEVEIRFVGKHP